ncbi:hypothetical protein [Nocardia alba]|uniref:Integral membrane protein n=1 Tax=Nocardia alba TaxID=225051 RepID=A0A4R1FLS9_9NOCA|nr:hypothetical protein [Nocardia alba]TCJ94990.1 hypothetical protein DFR71_3903 [Nocardia alba]
MRRIAVILLVCATGLLTLAAVVAGFLRAEVLDTDHYVDTVAPLAADPAIQTSVADALTRAVMARVDVEQAATELLQRVGDAEDRGPLATAAVRSVPALLAAQSEDLVRDAATTLVRSDGFSALWTAANRQAHRLLVAAVTGVDEGAIQVDTTGVVSISLDQMLDRVVDELDSRGFVLADKVAAAPTEFVVLESDELARAQRVVRLLDRSAIVLAIAAPICAALAILVAGRGSRRRAILAVAASVLVSMVVLAVALLIGRGIYLDHVRTASPDAARAVFDTVVGPLRVRMRVLAVLAVVVGLGAFLVGPSAPATWVRATADRLGERLRRGELGPVSGFLASNRNAVRGVVLIVAAAVLLFWDYPTVLVAVLIAVVTVVVLLALELVARPRRRATNQR